jgi:hypothetical protein
MDPDAVWCKCRKTACLKLYCRCFAAGILCQDTCTCTDDCANDRKDNPKRLKAVEAIKSRNAGAFSKSARKGCRCRNSRCLKKYCVCFAASKPCEADLCICINCANGLGGSSAREEAGPASLARGGAVGPAAGSRLTSPGSVFAPRGGRVDVSAGARVRAFTPVKTGAGTPSAAGRQGVRALTPEELFVEVERRQRQRRPVPLETPGFAQETSALLRKASPSGGIGSVSKSSVSPIAMDNARDFLQTVSALQGWGTAV